jgi:hypothetical protein
MVARAMQAATAVHRGCALADKGCLVPAWKVTQEVAELRRSVTCRTILLCEIVGGKYYMFNHGSLLVICCTICAAHCL